MLRSIFYFSLSLVSLAGFSQTPCDNGMAGPFECDGYDLISQIPLSVMNSVKANDSWGWTDPQDGKEYAIICLNEATAFIDISDPINPVYLGQLPGQSPEHTTWRDAKTYNNYVFIVSEDTGHGMQVFDLTRLRNIANPPVTFTNDAYYDGFGSAHNIAINEETGYAYVIGTDTFSGGAHFIDISDPLNPTADGGFPANGYSHDAQIVIYNGPDADYSGREILFGSNEDEIVIADITDKANPVTISTISYNNFSYTHQGWLTEDHRFFLLGDETDEIAFGFNSRTLVFDFQDLDAPAFHFEYYGATPATDHNGYVKGDRFYLANNAAGLRVMDISDLENMNMSQSGFFDSHPPTDVSGFTGSWNVYPFFESGHIVISDREQGFLLVKDPLLNTEDNLYENEFTIYPNPVKEVINVRSGSADIFDVRVTNMLGQTIFHSGQGNVENITIDSEGWSTGMYFLTVNNNFSRKIIKE